MGDGVVRQAQKMALEGGHRGHRTGGLGSHLRTNNDDQAACYDFELTTHLRVDTIVL